MKKYNEHIFVVGFVGTLVVMALLFFVFPHERFSELENRNLQQAPKLSFDNVLSKKFSEETEDFITDHFPFRGEWLAVKSTAEGLRLQQENNGIYRGKDGYLLEKVSEPNWDNIDRSIQSINTFASQHKETAITFMLAPTSVGLYEEKLPWMAPAYSQKDIHTYMETQISNHVTIIDGFDVLEPHTSEAIYYKTDHHWTTYGAFLAYDAYVKEMNWNPLQQEAFHVENVSESFLGSYHTRSQFSGVSPDTIQTFTPKAAQETDVYIADTDEWHATMYDEEFLHEKDQYSYFLGGVHALMEMETHLDAEEIDVEKLLVIKDSFAHSFLPFLTNHVSDIHVIDLRYYNGGIETYLEEHDITDVLLLLSTPTIVDQRILLK